MDHSKVERLKVIFGLNVYHKFYGKNFKWEKPADLFLTEGNLSPGYENITSPKIRKNPRMKSVAVTTFSKAADSDSTADIFRLFSDI